MMIKLLTLSAIQRSFGFYSKENYRNNLTKLSRNYCTQFKQSGKCGVKQFHIQVDSQPEYIGKIHQDGLNLSEAITDAFNILGEDVSPNKIISEYEEGNQNFFNSLRYLEKQISSTDNLISDFVHNNRSKVCLPGVVCLLLSKSAVEHNLQSEQTESKEKHKKQQYVAEACNLLYAGFLLHSGIRNYPVTKDTKQLFAPVNSTNKVNILGGDLFIMLGLSKASLVKMDKMNDITLATVRRSIEGEFAWEEDIVNNNFLHSRFGLPYWEILSNNMLGELFANGCRTVLELAGCGEDTQTKGLQFGRQFALSYQAFSDIDEILNYNPASQCTFRLSSLPILLHLREDEKLKKYITLNKSHLDNMNFCMLHNAVRSEETITKAKQILEYYKTQAFSSLKNFGSSKASEALVNLLLSFQPKIENNQ